MSIIEAMAELGEELVTVDHTPEGNADIAEAIANLGAILVESGETAETI